MAGPSKGTFEIVSAAVEPYREQAVEKAEEYAEETIGRLAAQLREEGGNLNAVAPRPTASDYGVYEAKKQRRALFEKLFPVDRIEGADPLRPGRAETFLSPTPRPESVARFVVEARKDSSVQFDAYVAKLATKVGAITAAEMSGPYIWQGSILTVTKPDGAEEHWKTTMIVNISKYGKVFNQFPTRKVKGPTRSKAKKKKKASKKKTTGAVPWEEALQRVQASPQFPSSTDWDRYAKQWGIQGKSFTWGTMRVADLDDLNRSGSLYLSQHLDDAEIKAKGRSGNLNPVVITYVEGRRLVVVDGTHSLIAAARRGDERVTVLASNVARKFLQDRGVEFEPLAMP